jgi:hypothetical protein
LQIRNDAEKCVAGAVDGDKREARSINKQGQIDMPLQTFPCVTIDVIGGEREENAFYGETYAEVRAIADRRIADGDFAEVIFECEPK